MYEFLEFCSVVLACEGVRVFPVGKQANFDIHSFFQQHVDTTERSLDTCYVTVIEYRNVIGEAVNELNLSRSQCRTRRSYHILHT